VTGRVLVAGVGNIFLGDDGFGPEVVRRLADRPLPPDVRVVDYGIRGMHLAYDLLDDVDLLVLVDAAPRGGRPGDVVLLEVGEDGDAGQLGLARWPAAQDVRARLRAGRHERGDRAEPGGRRGGGRCGGDGGRAARPGEGGVGMRVVGWVATGLVAGLVLAVVVAGVSSSGDVKRYLRMRRM
jgi:hypothetical protein